MLKKRGFGTRSRLILVRISKKNFPKGGGGGIEEWVGVVH